jgi:hypothetical protein
MTTYEPTREETQRYAEMAMNWYGWGSPIGFSILLLSITGSLYLLHLAGLIR